VYITGGDKDTVVFNAFQEGQKMVYDAHGADTDLVIDKGRGHALKDNTVYDALQYMYQRLPGSGVTKDKPLV
jgi:hypothetical protein